MYFDWSLNLRDRTIYTDRSENENYAQFYYKAQITSTTTDNEVTFVGVGNSYGLDQEPIGRTS